MFIVRKKNISRSRKPGPEAKKVAQSAERQNQSGKDSGSDNKPRLAGSEVEDRVMPTSGEATPSEDRPPRKRENGPPPETTYCLGVQA